MTAQKLISANKEDEALVYLNACLNQRPYDKEALFTRAKIYNNKKLYLEALTDYNALLFMEPENREALYSRGIIRFYLEQFEMALEDFKKLRDLPPEGETQTAYFKTDESGEMVTGIATMNTLTADILDHIGLCYYHMGQYNKAIETFDEGISQSPSAELYLNRAMVKEKQGDLESALRDYQFVTKNYPGNELAAWNLLTLKQKLNAGKSNLSELNKFIDRFPQVSGGYASRAMFFYEKNEFSAALRDFREAVRLNPENEDYLFNLGLCYIKLNKLDDAEITFVKLTAMDPLHAEAWFNLGNVRFKQKDFDEAIACYTIALHHAPDKAGVLYNRALAYYNKDLLTEACADMKRAKKFDPTLGKADKFLRKNCKDY